MPVKPSEEEEKHFKEEDRRLLDRMKGDAQLDEQTRQLWLEVARQVGSENVSLGGRMVELGFTPETARVIFAVPMVEVAWADGKVSYEESYKLVEIVRKRGVKAHSAGFDYLSKLTLTRPAKSWFEGCNEVLRELLDNMPALQRNKELADFADLAVQVAKASRGFFGLGPEVNKQEREVIQELASDLGLDKSEKATDLLKDL